MSAILGKIIFTFDMLKYIYKTLVRQVAKYLKNELSCERLIQIFSLNCENMQSLKSGSGSTQKPALSARESKTTPF